MAEEAKILLWSILRSRTKGFKYSLTEWPLNPLVFVRVVISVYVLGGSFCHIIIRLQFYVCECSLLILCRGWYVCFWFRISVCLLRHWGLVRLLCSIHFSASGNGFYCLCGAGLA
jgi:hypothetical protein